MGAKTIFKPHCTIANQFLKPEDCTQVNELSGVHKAKCQDYDNAHQVDWEATRKTNDTRI